MSQTSSYNPFPGDISHDNIEEIIAFHKATFGGFRMEDEGSEGDQPDDQSEPDEQEESTDEASEDEQPDGADEDAGDDEDVENEAENELPEWARSELGKVRKEAARYRTKLRDMEQRFEGAKTAEEFQTALDGLREDNAEENRALLVENVALKHKLPKELAARLQGATREELEEDAKSLQKFAPQDEDEHRELSGGLDPFDKDTEPSDPRELGRRARGVRTR